jgi:hypothetical protein
MENRAGTLAKVVRCFSRSDAAGMKDAESGERCVFAKGALVLFPDGASAQAADYFRKRRVAAFYSVEACRGVPTTSVQLDVARRDTRKPSVQLDVARRDIRKPSVQLDVARRDIRKPSVQLDVARRDIRKPSDQLDVARLGIFIHLADLEVVNFSHKTPVFS